MITTKVKPSHAWPTPRIIRGKTWREYMDSTTFHGVSNIFDRDHSIIRRIIWACFVLTALAFFLYQVISRSIDFNAKETTVDVEVIYAGKLNYPTVTVCNQNKFKITKTSHMGLYKFIQNFYTLQNRKKSSLMIPRGFSIDTKTIFKTAGHQKSDLIYSCEWAGRNCTSDQIIETITEYGICYTFNSIRSKNQSELLTVSESGTANALSIVLNIEQYEYMNGPDNDAGVKIFLHNDYTRPLMTDLGFAVASGTHTLVGVRRIESYSLDAPYGNCIHSNFKSHAECVDHCRMRVVSERCKCIPYEASSILTVSNTTGICKIKENLICVTRELAKVKKNKNLCSCLVPCAQIVYEPSLSYSKISQLSADKVTLGDTDTLQKLKKSLKEALETGEIFVEEKRANNRLFMSSFSTATDQFLAAIDTLNTLLTDTSNYKAAVIPNMMELWEIVKEDLSITMMNIQKAYRFSSTNKMSSLEDDLEPVEKDLEKNIPDVFYVSKDDKSLQALKDIETCFIRNGNNSNALWNCDDIKSNFNKLGPKGPQGPGSPRKKYWDLFIGDDFLKSLSGILDIEVPFKEEIMKIFGKNLTDDSMRGINKKCLPVLNRITVVRNKVASSISVLGANVSLAQKKEEVVNLYEGLKKIPQFVEPLEDLCFFFADDDFWEEKLGMKGMIIGFEKAYGEYKVYNREVEKYINNTKKKVERINELNTMMTEYLKLDNYSANLTKESIYEKLSSTTMDRDLNEIALADQYVSTLSTNFEASFKTTVSSLRHIERKLNELVTWPFPIVNREGNKTSPLSLLFPNYTLQYENDKLNKLNCINITWTLNNYEGCVDVISTIYQKEWQNALREVSKYGYNMDKSAENLKDEIYAYRKLLKVDGDFFFRNFAKVDIYYKELSYQKIQQLEKFEFLSLISEIGGFMGLLLGASVLTIIELLEYFVVRVSNT
ncbi:DgyrCDS12268 [Dimorphilus gyrociliatus]|uniref:DgyrCDS12268 n=1 Tax=Dimorphilus gyrociliatus TaxID=2664684 RepID=A0A7I8W7P1_9ANNE|nr:DgyrCDS12268 [Dimorphilus gyrociliatus]